MTSLTNFLYSRSRYYGQVKPENLAFNANLQKFSQSVSLICGLETGGKVSQDEAYKQIEALWEQLKRTREQLSMSKLSGSNAEPYLYLAEEGFEA